MRREWEQATEFVKAVYLLAARRTVLSEAQSSNIASTLIYT